MAGGVETASFRPMQPVTVQFLKKRDIIHWGFECFRLGEDEYGVWLSTPRGTRRWKGPVDRSPVLTNAAFCIPRNDWWTLHYNGTATDKSHFVDITTPSTWVSEGRVEMIDLDLDVVLHQDGTLEVEDEDEFAVHQLQYGYTGEEILKARETTDRIVAALHAREEPFFEVARGWWERVRALD